MKFGNLTLIGFSEPKILPSGKKLKTAIVSCECGIECRKDYQRLKCGMFTSCNQCSRSKIKRLSEEEKKRRKKTQEQEYLNSENGKKTRKKAYTNYYNNHKDKYEERRIKLANEISDSYCTTYLRRKGFQLEEIKENKELVHIQRIIIKTKRLCKTSPN